MSMTNTTISFNRLAFGEWYGRILFASTLLLSWMTVRVIQDFVFLPSTFDIETQKLSDPDRPTNDTPSENSEEHLRLRKLYGIEDERKEPTAEQLAAYHERYDKPSASSQAVNFIIPFLGKRDPKSLLWESIWLGYFFLWIIVAPTLLFKLWAGRRARRP